MLISEIIKCKCIQKQTYMNLKWNVGLYFNAYHIMIWALLASIKMNLTSVDAVFAPVSRWGWVTKETWTFFISQAVWRSWACSDCSFFHAVICINASVCVVMTMARKEDWGSGCESACGCLSSLTVLVLNWSAPVNQWTTLHVFICDFRQSSW